MMIKKILKRSCLMLSTLVFMLYVNPGPTISFHFPKALNTKVQAATPPATQAPVAQAYKGECPSSNVTQDTTLGILTYYNQTDPRWSDYLYGGQDPVASYGCGPTAVSMIISSFTDTPMNPAQMAQWSYEHSYWSSGSGSEHALIPDSLSAFGLHVESITNCTVDAIISSLTSGHVLVFLMDRGYFTQSGHFIILTNITPDGQITIADPSNIAHTTQTWDPAFLIQELRSSANAGGPAWSVSK
ncbi:MAG: C39 family peptidase [Lachnospiraceae bacterium]